MIKLPRSEDETFLIWLILVLIIQFILSCGAYERKDCYAEGSGCGTVPSTPDPILIPGPTGPAGSPGATGSQGERGSRGDQGESGEGGAAGTVGPSGADGQDGSPGPAGLPGAPGTAGPTGDDGPQGPEGKQGPSGSSGTNGSQGPTGLDGPSGNPGLTGAPGGAGPTGSNGATGPTGESGRDAPTSPYDIIELINPCGGAGQGFFDEVLLKLRNGMILAHYSDGSKQFLTIVLPGSYQTTDGYHCNFIVHSDGSITW